MMVDVERRSRYHKSMATKYKSLFLLLLLPLLFVFDVGIYLVTRATCFECHGIGEFIKNSSLASAVIIDSIRIWRNN